MVSIDLVERLRTTRAGELGPGEWYLGATRLSIPRPPRRPEIQSRGFRIGPRTERGPVERAENPFSREVQRIPGFPTAWDMTLGLTPSRMIVWATGRTGGTGELLGHVLLVDLTEIELRVVPAPRGGRSLAVRFVQRNAPVVMFDVIAGHRADTEHFVEQAAQLLRVG